MKRHWNYRVIKTRRPSNAEPLNEELAIHEVHYEDDKIVGWSENVVPSTFGNNEEPVDPKDLKWSLEKMLEAFEKPILNAEDLD